MPHVTAGAEAVAAALPAALSERSLAARERLLSEDEVHSDSESSVQPTVT